jgi:GDP/UDP-N,N'-diacetylbacillosamine 2-epimerase (hydrolysing)
VETAGWKACCAWDCIRLANRDQGPAMRLRVAVVTVARSDYGIYYPVLRLLETDAQIELKLIVAAGHLDPKYGLTVREIEQDGFSIDARVPMTMKGDSREDVANAIGTGVQEFASAYCQIRPDVVLLLGDRYEMMAAAVAALPLRIPLAHIHGGELTLGAIDDAIRHAITKLSHIHFAATIEYARRIRQMGEEPWRVHVTGSPAVDSIRSFEPIPKAKLDDEFGMDVARTLLITYHPVTLEDEDSNRDSLSNLLVAASESGCSLLFTYPNADSQNGEIIERVSNFVHARKDARVVLNLGHRKYHSMQTYVAAMVGNSSSGIIEAGTFQLPVVNIGTRQQGRIRGAHVIDVATSKQAILRGISTAISSAFRQSLVGTQNPYGNGRSAERIVSLLKSVERGQTLIVKRFVDDPSRFETHPL